MKKLIALMTVFFISSCTSYQSIPDRRPINLIDEPCAQLATDKGFYKDYELIADCNKLICNSPNDSIIAIKAVNLCLFRSQAGENNPGITISGQITNINNVTKKIWLHEPFDYKGWPMDPVFENDEYIKLENGSFKRKENYVVNFDKSKAILTLEKKTFKNPYLTIIDPLFGTPIISYGKRKYSDVHNFSAQCRIINKSIMY